MEEPMGQSLSIGIAVLFSLVAQPSGAVQPEQETPASEYRKLISKYEQAQERYKKAYQEARTFAEQRKVEKDLKPSTNREMYAPDFLGIIEKYPKDAVAIDAYIWLLTEWPWPPNFYKATEI